MFNTQESNATIESDEDNSPEALNDQVAPIEGGLDAIRDYFPEAAEQLDDEELSFYSAASDHVHGDDNIWGLLSGVCGNIFEWFDFAVYGLLAPEIGQNFFPKSSRELQLINSFGVYLAPEIGQNFFPKSSRELQLINSFGVYLAAFIMRPLGAILFGELGDRIVGRKNALAFSIVLITVPSVLLGILPTYAAWGWVAPVLLVLLRMMQGLSVGGQLAGSYVLSIEQSSSSSRGFRGSVCDASSVGGFLLASAVTTFTRCVLSKDDLVSWGWRIPFLFSLLLAPLLYFIVGKTEESKLWAERAEQKETEHILRETEHAEGLAVVDLVSSPFRRRQLAGMIGVLSAVASSFYVLFLWTPVYLSELRGVMEDHEADFLNFIVVGCYIVFLLIAGKVSDSFPHRIDLVRIGLPAMIVGCPVMFGMFESESYFGILLGQLQFAACLAMVQGSMAAWEVELWMADPTLSFTGVAIGHNIAATVFGGTMPLVATFLFYRSNRMAENLGDDALFPRLVPGLYISLLGCISLYCISYVTRHPHDVRTGSKELKEAIHMQNQKFKEAKKEKLKRRTLLEDDDAARSNIELPKTDDAVKPIYLPPII